LNCSWPESIPKNGKPGREICAIEIPMTETLSEPKRQRRKLRFLHHEISEKLLECHFSMGTRCAGAIALMRSHVGEF